MNISLNSDKKINKKIKPLQPEKFPEIFQSFFSQKRNSNSSETADFLKQLEKFN
jgi:hypothetical protein